MVSKGSHFADFRDCVHILARVLRNLIGGNKCNIRQDVAEKSTTRETATTDPVVI